MEAFTVIFSSSCCENIEELELKRLLSSLERQVSSSSFAPIEKSFYSVVLPCCLQVDQSCEWREFDDTYATHKDGCLKCCKKVDMYEIAEKLHALADSLPELGCYVDVVWIETQLWPDFDSNLDIYGALKHFSEWYNTKLYIMSREIFNDGEDPCKTEWIKRIASVEKVFNTPDDTNTGEIYDWRGSILIKSGQSLKPLKLPGFHLKQDRLPQSTICQEKFIAMPYMEMIAPLDIQEIPSFYILPDTYRLYIDKCDHHTLNKSKHFLQVLKENRKLSYLLRLSFGTSRLSEKKTKCSKRSWLSTVLNDLHSVQDSLIQTELTGNCGNHMFLVCFDKDCGNFIAYPLQNLKHLKANPMHSIALKEISGAYIDSNHVNPKEMFSSIPSISVGDYMHIMKNTENLQRQVLEMWTKHQNKEFDDTETELNARLYLVEAVQKWYMNRVLVTLKENENQSSYTISKLVDPKPEFESTFEQLERLILQCRHKSNDKLNKNKSNDSLGGLSPPTKSKVLALNAEEFLKFFKVNGAARKESKSVLSVRKNPLCKYDSSESQFAEWSDFVLPKNFHDLYYHCGDLSDKIEEKTERLKAKLISVEYSTTCSIKQGNSPTAMLLPLSPDKSKQLKKSPVVSDENKDKSSINRNKRKRSDQESENNVKKVYKNKKQQLEEKKAESKHSRSMRHKKKLEEVISNTLAENGVTKGDVLFKPCFRKLYTITYTFVKDLRGYTSLREEMEKIAKSNVEMVVSFEKLQSKK